MIVYSIVNIQHVAIHVKKKHRSNLIRPVIYEMKKKHVLHFLSTSLSFSIRPEMAFVSSDDHQEPQITLAVNLILSILKPEVK